MLTKKRLLIPLISIVAIGGSLLAALSINMLMGDVANYALGFSKMTIFVTLVALCFTLEAVAMFFYLLRLVQRPKTIRRLSATYLIIIASLALLCFISAILAGTINYHSFTRPYPFPGYLIIALILSALLIAGCILCLIFVIKKLPKDEERFKVTPLYVIKTILWFHFILLAFNRFGMLLGSPTFIQWRTFYMTWPFYLFLAIPAYLAVIKVLDLLGFMKTFPKMILSLSGLVANTILFAVIILLGLRDTSFIAGVSQCMPLERLMSGPIELFIHFTAYLIMGLALLIPSMIALHKERKQHA